MQNEKSKEKNLALRVSAVTIGVNLLLAFVKLVAGIIGQSSAMISDAVHSASDVFSTFIVIGGVFIAGKTADEEHPYGHERLESIASIVLSFVLVITGLGIGIKGLEKALYGGSNALQVPGSFALFAAILSIVIKEWMYWYTRSAAKKINSGALMADAWHHRSDALSSVGAFIGIFGARLGFPILDPIASLVICFFIGKASWDIFKDAVDKLVDKSCSEEEIKNLSKLIMTHQGIQKIDKLKTRMFGTKVYVDVEVAVDASMTLSEAHRIAEEVHDLVEDKFQHVKHCMIHVNPFDTDEIY